MPPSVSVVCTFLNAEDTLEATLESLVNQTASEIQFILIDDGSVDRSASIAERYRASDSRFILATNPSRGRINALNWAMAKAKSEFVAILDADDVAHPAWLDDGLQAIRPLPDFAVISFERLFLRGLARPNWESVDAATDPSVRNVTHTLVQGNQIPHSGAFIRRSHLVEVGYYDSRRTCLEDYDLWIRLAKVGHQLGRSRLVRIAKRYHAGQKFSKKKGHLLASFKVQYRAIMTIDRRYDNLVWLGVRAGKEFFRSLRRTHGSGG